MTPDELEFFGQYIENVRNFNPLVLGHEEVAAVLADRMEQTGAATVSQYVDTLEVRPKEFQLLMDALYGDMVPLCESNPAWNYLNEKIIPSLAHAEEPVRVWCVDSKTGWEAFLITMLFCERMGVDALQKNCKVFVTHEAESTLALARQASIDAQAYAKLPDALGARYCTQVNQRYVLQNELRRVIIFGKHNVLSDPYISKMDLVLALNVLPYFDAEKQDLIVETKLRVAMKPNRFLIVGAGQSIEQRGLTTCATSVYLKTNDTASGVPRQAGSADLLPGELTNAERLHEFAFDSSPNAHIVVDDKALIALVNSQARRTFGLAGVDIGRPLRDLEVSYRPAELRSLIENAKLQRAGVSARCSRVNSAGHQEHFDVFVRQISDVQMNIKGVSIQYVDTTPTEGLKQSVFDLNEQLQTANEELQSAHEELETANEELQSTNEELETTNEELQSTNEELETINEELQSTNSELESTNAQQRLLAGSIDRTNHVLEAILGSMRSALIVLDESFHVLIWNRRAEDLWGPRPEEVLQQNFFGLDIGLPVEQLVAPLRLFQTSNDKTQHLTVSGRTRTGKDLECEIRMARINLDRSTGTVLVINDVKAQASYD